MWLLCWHIYYSPPLSTWHTPIGCSPYQTLTKRIQLASPPTVVILKATLGLVTQLIAWRYITWEAPNHQPPPTLIKAFSVTTQRNLWLTLDLLSQELMWKQHQKLFILAVGWGVLHTRATPKTPVAAVARNTSPMYSPEIQGWDFRWLELLEWLEEGG